MMHSQPLIETRLILSGLGGADRRSLCEIYAFLRDETAIRQIGDLVRRQYASAKSRVVAQDAPTMDRLKQRLEVAASEVNESELDTDAIRLIVWVLLREAYGLPPAITYSNRGAGEITTDVGGRMAETYFKNADSAWLKPVPSRLRQTIGKPRLHGSFSEMVEDHVLKQVKSLTEDCQFRSDEEREALFRALCTTNHAVDASLDTNAGRQALAKALGTSGSVASLAAAVEMAGFSAYILAAQASAVIPLVGGKTLVSLLAVVANPVFVIPAVLGGAWWAKSSSDHKLRTAFASITGATLSLIGLQDADRGLNRMVGVFRDGDAHLANIAAYVPSMAKHATAYRGLASRMTPYRHDIPAMPAGDWFRRPVGDAGQDVRGFNALMSGILSEKRERMVLSTIAVGDLVYHTAMIDPEVIQAVDFSSAAGAEGVFDFALFADALRERTGMSLAGAEGRIKGYVAEETVIHRLIDDGYVVGRPESASEPGFDLYVDGQKFQVKCVEDLGGIQEHFEKYPDIPVFANAELEPVLKESAAPWADHVYFLQGFNNEQVTEATQDSLDAGEDMFDLDLPIFVVTLAAARNVHGWWRGQLPANELVWTTGTDVAGRGACSVVGGFAGAAAGLLLLGPAGAVIGGPTGTILGAGSFGRMKRSVGSRVDREAKRGFYEAADQLLRRCLQVLEEKKAALSTRIKQLGESGVAGYVRSRLGDDMQFILEQEAHLRDQLDLVGGQETTCDNILATCLQSHVHPSRLQAELVALHEARLKLERGLASQAQKGTKSIGRGVLRGWRSASDYRAGFWKRRFQK